MFDTEEVLRRLTSRIPDNPFEHTTIFFDEIVSNMRKKMAMTFDQGSLRRFLTRAMLQGLCLVAEDDFVPNDLDIYMTRISIIPD